MGQVPAAKYQHQVPAQVAALVPARIKYVHILLFTHVLRFQELLRKVYLINYKCMYKCIYMLIDVPIHVLFIIYLYGYLFS